ncbi:MAG: dolichyl-phosphate-mannose--protein mannosyltransferase [Microbacterium sp. SCN 70-27]|uniref:dolichyl-phosphate-mannose--protein mannosyltransferase n=1 Tax=unclassified Microbacterium TaxID=2609290 RepID=UPI00086886C7|nr:MULTISPECIES: phospholipid carrier-dependent glycosyltransferase [unclassified Microbacterium]MBN9224072.1 phospholipid carrier-dependent glycosyltransferase [Microbacterium sp.]ODT27634.1 MAG: dolichyl-phosphate-mannose--protein mannosyltransferase [Microbacterium sp. SCN 70-27]
MTTTDPLLLPAARPSSYDRWRLRVVSDPALARLYAWLAPTLVTVLAGILRFWNLGQPHALVFDETYYVKDAWSQWNLGYASRWPDDANADFVAGHADIFTTDPSFVVHPPLGKYLIGAGMWLFGPENAFGWRFATALFGTALVLLLFLVAKSMTNSTAFASVASFLLAIDGLGIVMSKVALLDIFLAFFVLLAFWFVVLDRKATAGHLAARTLARERDGSAPAWGPVLWGRPWLIAAGAAAGAATAVKWSGVWVLAAIGLYLVVSDALERRRLGITFWPTDAVRQGAASFVLLVPVAAVVYLSSWVGWLATDGGYDRHAADAQPATGIFSWVPLSLQSLWKYHVTIYNSMTGMTSPHSYASPAWQWPLLWRPTAMYANSAADGQGGCAGGQGGCIEILYSMPNPLLWYASIAAAGYLVYRFVLDRDWRQALVLVGIAATWLPWLAYPERTIFQFYTIVLWPFLLLALTFALQRVAGATSADRDRRTAGQRVVLVFLGVAVALSIFWYPLWSGMQVPYEFYRLHNWMQGWV